MELQSGHTDSFELDEFKDRVLYLNQENSRPDEFYDDVDQLLLTNHTAVSSTVFCS